MNRRPRITFGMIVLNGEPFLRYNLRSLYPYAHQIIVVEGACVAAASIATPEGHSTDDTLETLRQFKSQEDPEDKLTIVTAEEEGKPNGFWTEKDEMSQAYARRATGDWLWQVDYDEFYLERDIERVMQMMEKDPEIAGFSFPFLQFWGGFDYLEDGEYFWYEQPCVHRIFRWRKGYRYTRHRPPTVVDDLGRDLRTSRKWISYRHMRRASMYMHHYSAILPKQAEQKAGYYPCVTWTDTFRHDERCLKENYLKLTSPYHVGVGLTGPTWLRRYQGRHPGQIARLREEVERGQLKLLLRPSEDIEELLASPSYVLVRCGLNILLPLKWYLWRRPIQKFRQLVSKTLSKGI